MNNQSPVVRPVLPNVFRQQIMAALKLPDCCSSSSMQPNSIQELRTAADSHPPVAGATLSADMQQLYQVQLAQQQAR